ncbi:MAG: 2-oxoglutarate ferredoxin oxidoreductase subunit beta [Deltaproteobacteria bacterium]|jgi:2-oxoglutarate ferredoxin oxidoreductase subunit beta|nr:2-oxoglutarate ferredoxin oxidoreductase subunit beta [Deltaproteobacteria bacterium]
MDRLFHKFLRARKIPSTACSGCGLGQVHKRVLLALERLDLGPDDVVWGTGIGCAGRQTFNTWRGDNFAGTHGRVYAIAAGLRVALGPGKKIVLTAGDGDAFGIGLKHLLNCARRNVDMTVVVADNLGYQSTGGQFGITTPRGSVTDSSPYGLNEPGWLGGGLDVLEILKAAGATYLARHLSLDGASSVESLVMALENPGFSLVHFIYPCVTHFGAVTLGERDKGKILGSFRAMFAGGGKGGPTDRDDGRGGETDGGGRKDPGPQAGSGPVSGDPAFRLKRGTYHDGRGLRPEFAASLIAWTKNVREGAGR